MPELIIPINRLISATWLGMISRLLLDDAHQGEIVGTTTRGIFIKLDSNWTLFLSYENYRGPLTMNLSGGRSIANQVKVHQAIRILDGKFQILPSGIEIDFSRAKTWQAPPRSQDVLSADDRTRFLDAVAGLILAARSDSGLYLALADILAIETGDRRYLPPAYEWADFSRLLHALKEADLTGISAALTPFMGLGLGLTPAGDDLILGLLLAYNRWEFVLRPAFNLVELTGQLIKVASLKTTLLSANLIACAAQGQADERLIDALDGLITGAPPPEQCAHSLSTWGNSSGSDALVGMALAILSTQPDAGA